MNRDDDMREKLGNAPDNPPESWIPEVGDTIAGVVVEYSEGETIHGRHPIVTIEDDQGVLHAIWLMHKILYDEFRRQRPKPGERIGVRRQSDGEGGRGKSGYKRYRLIVDREGDDGLSVLARDDLAPGDIPPGTKMTQADALADDPTDNTEPGSDFSRSALEGKDDLPF